MSCHFTVLHVSAAATIIYTNLGADLVLGDLEPGPPLAGQQEDGGGQLHLHTALQLHVESGE